MQAKKNISPEEINFSSKHVLFVEGTADSIDVEALENILDINIEPMGPSYWIKSVAKALAPTHPTYYFLIDRDHYDDQAVEDYWKEFPNTETPNLLVWRKKEIENYFLEPNYLAQSKYFVKTKEELKDIILKEAQNRLFLNITNQVIISIREDFKANWIEIYKTNTDFNSKEAAIEQLIKNESFSDFRNKADSLTVEKQLIERFEYFHELMSCREDTLSWDKGRWLEMIAGKEILNNVLNSNCFKVKNRNGDLLQGKKKFKEIIKELLNDSKDLPVDFIELKTLVEQRKATA